MGAFDLLKGDYFDYYPSDIKQSSDPDFRRLADKINELRDQLVNRGSGNGFDNTIEDLDNIFKIERSPRKVLKLLGDMIGYEFDNTKSDTQLRKEIFSWVEENKTYATTDYLRRRVQEVTGVLPTIREAVTPFTGWDQNFTIDGVPEPVDFGGGIAWDQTNEYNDILFLKPFRWFVTRTGLLIDLKNDGVFDANPTVNAAILEEAYKTIAKYKGADVIAEVGYVDSITGVDMILRYIYSKDIILVTDSPPAGSINNQDPGLEF